jgi:hypothetical protein
MTPHIGEKIKEEVYKQEIPITVFARKIGRTRNSVYDIFERPSVQLDLLKKISAVLKCDFISLYSMDKYPSVESTESPSEPAGNYLDEHIDILEQKIRLLDTELQLLKKELASFRAGRI